jgi:hypothetical protein
MTDRTYYEECCRACPTVGRQFYDRDQSLTAAIERMIQLLAPALAPATAAKV